MICKTDQTETFTYNRLGQVTGKTDRNGTVHSYGYDPLGRLISDTATTLGAGVDGAIRRLGYTYNGQGQPERFTSYANTGGTNVVNEVQRQYNGFGQLIAEYQAHDGAVNTGSTPRVQYTYAAEDKGARLTGMVYPDGRVLSYSYGTAGQLNDRISRLQALIDNDGTTTLEGFSYLGLSTVVERTHGNGVNLTHIGTGTGDAGDQYVGLDRFSRIVVHNWTNGSTSLDHYTYVYDRNSNRTAKNNTLNADLNESYAYDSLNRLNGFERTNGREQNWNLDALGNWQSITTDGTPQSRTHNDQNQIVTISGATSPTHDANGNMTTDQDGKTLVYDAWNRLVEAKGGSTTLQRYEYDALKRRIEALGLKFFHSIQWQVLEEREGGVVKAQYVWSPVYVDAMVLRDRDANGQGGDGLEERVYVTHDANFNVTSIVNLSGQVLERYVYLPYGDRTVLNADWTVDGDGISGLSFNHGHQGGKIDIITGLIHFRHREYSAELGRWVQQDPKRYIDSLSMYSAFAARPIVAHDPMGTVVILIHGVNTEAGWFKAAEDGLNEFWDKSGQPRQAVIGFAWGDPIAARGFAAKQGGQPNYATDSVAGMNSRVKDRSYMLNARDRLKSLIGSLNRIGQQEKSCEPITVIAHSQGTMIMVVSVKLRTLVESFSAGRSPAVMPEP